MRRVSLPLAGLEYMIRSEICDHCPHRTPVNGPNGQRACQSGCAQYEAVPALYDVARRLDPMIANVAETLKHHMPLTGPGVNWGRGRRRNVVTLIRKYLNV
jgi:hypothetical protein